MTRCISIEVVNIHHPNPDGKKITYIGRGSPYGNPFPTRDESERDLVCDKYHDYFVDHLESDPEFIQSLQNLANLATEQGYLRLGCFCDPKRCHGLTVAAYLRIILKDQGCHVI